MKAINLTQVREREWISEAFAPEKAAVTLRVEFEAQTPGNSLVVERSITGSDWVVAAIVAGYGSDARTQEFGVDGITKGQQLRLVAGAAARAMYIE